MPTGISWLSFTSAATKGPLARQANTKWSRRALARSRARLILRVMPTKTERASAQKA
jgi:hypothetical protein